MIKNITSEKNDFCNSKMFLVEKFRAEEIKLPIVQSFLQKFEAQKHATYNFYTLIFVHSLILELFF